MKKIPKKLIKSAYRRKLWQNTRMIMNRIEAKLPIAEVYLLGSFASKKNRPADVDFVVLLKTVSHNQADWSVDLVIAPDNDHGDFILRDAAKWMKQKYGAKKSAVIRLR